MPNLPAHIALALRVAERVGSSTLDSNIGCFLLGSTSPDVRIITRARREEYHFAPLSFESVGAGVKGLFDAHPNLLLKSINNRPTRAFVAGYMTHLILDETWIVRIYRPFFGNPMLFNDEIYGRVMDRALQLELDHMLYGVAQSTMPLLAQSADDVNVGFISADTLISWHQWVLEFIARDFTWNRLSFMARRIARGDEGHLVHDVAAEFLKNVPNSREHRYTVVSHDEMDRFQEDAVDVLVRTVADYLS